MSFWDMLLRLLVATVCGGVIGIERGKKNRPAGFRTYILVCVGASLTMILSEYIVHMYPLWKDIAPELVKSDMSRFGAQVINGIGFLGAGTIIITGNQQVKGMTIIEYLTNYRMEIAKTYIERFGLRAYEAADMVGIDDPAYFSRVFKKLYGKSVSEYKKRK